MVKNNCLIKRKVIVPVGLIIFLLLQFSAFAQSNTGGIKGTIRDSVTKEVLFGANILISGTSMGAASDIDGKYVISPVDPGTYKVMVRYIGYITKEFTVRVQENKVATLNASLVAQALEGQEITITAQAQGQLGAINQQLSSNTIKNVVSADKIRQLPDDNAATALSRLPGVSLMNGDQVVIRGIEAKLNQVLVNGIQMPSTDMSNRSTNLGFISSNMLAGIEVIKAITPDMDANTIGGVVNLKLATANPGWHFDVMAQGNYNSTDRTTSTYKMWGSVSNRFFDDNLGVIVEGNSERSDQGDQYANLNYGGPDGSGSTLYGQGVYVPGSASFNLDRYLNTTNGGSLILDYKLPNGKIIMQNTYAAYVVDQRNNSNTLNFGGTNVNYSINRNKYGKELWVNALQLENTFGDVKVEASLSHSYTDQYTKIAYDAGNWFTFSNNSSLQTPFGVGADGKPIKYDNNFKQMSIDMQRAYYLYDNVPTWDADSARQGGWVGAMSQWFKQHLYNASLDVSVPVSFSDAVTATFKLGGKFTRTTRTNNFDRFFGGQNPYISVYNYFGGGQNAVTISKPLKYSLIKDYDYPRAKYFLQDEYNFKNGFANAANTDIYDAFIQKAITGWEVPYEKDLTYKDDWNGAESFSAGYLMGTFNIFDNINVVGGLRYEAYNMQYHAQYTFVIHSVDGDCITTETGTIVDVPDDSPYANVPAGVEDTVYKHHAIGYSKNNVNRTDYNFFPSIQAKFKINDWSDLRLAYTTGISRPDYSAILPKVAIYPNQRIEMGNPLLRPTTAKNIDVIYSIFSNKVGLFTINGFYKELKDVIYGTTIYYSEAPKYAQDVPIPDSTFVWNHFGYAFNKSDGVGVSLNNPNKGYVRGVEIDWQTNFWYLPEPFNSLILNINYTKSASHLDYRILTPIPITSRDSRGHTIVTYTTRDTTFSGPLVQQANDVINASIGIDYKGFSGRLSFNMRGNVINFVGSRPEGTSYTGNILRWDFTLKQNLPVDGLSLSLNGVNIFHNVVKSYQDFRLNPTAPVTSNLVSVRYSPTIFQMNLRYTF